MVDAATKAKILGMVSKVPAPFPIIVLILNIIFPGWGTILSAFIDERSNKNMVETLLIGLVQFFFSWTIVGWIFSIVWGYLIYKRSTGLLSIV